MARVNPVALPRIKERRESKTFVDPEQAESLPLTFRRRSLLELSEWLEQAEGWAEDFKDGIPIDDEVKIVTLNQWQTVATLCAVQCPDQGDAAYSNLEWLYIMTRYPNVWPEIVKLAIKVQGLDGNLGNSPGVSDGPSTPPSLLSMDSMPTSLSTS